MLGHKGCRIFLIKFWWDTLFSINFLKDLKKEVKDNIVLNKTDESFSGISGADGIILWLCFSKNFKYLFLISIAFISLSP